MENNLVNNKNCTVILNKFVLNKSVDEKNKSVDEKNKFIIDSLSLDFTDKEYTTVSTHNITSSEDIINIINDMDVIVGRITYIETEIAKKI